MNSWARAKTVAKDKGRQCIRELCATERTDDRCGEVVANFKM